MSHLEEAIRHLYDAAHGARASGEDAWADAIGGRAADLTQLRDAIARYGPTEQLDAAGQLFPPGYPYDRAPREPIAHYAARIAARLDRETVYSSSWLMGTRALAGVVAELAAEVTR